MNILIIGGTRNIGFSLAQRLVDEGHRLTILNRGISRDDLPKSVARLRCDRTDAVQMRRALGGRQFDVVVDMVVFKGHEAETIVEILNGQVGHYLFISTGQVYLVREGLERPFKESDYEGPLMPQPEMNTYDYEEWLYGIDKRRAEDHFIAAHAEHGFPFTSLRIPMVNGERDTFNRLYGYMLRIKDGGPILVPEGHNLPLRHIYSHDAVEAIMKLIARGPAQGKAYNIAQDETVSLGEFLAMLGDIVGMRPNVVEVERGLLEANGFLPDCSPFSDLWMSELDNTLSKKELGMRYTPLKTYIERIVGFYDANPPRQQPTSYRRRNSERQLVLQRS